MNSLQLAPFNDSMQLGQGYNSFLQRPCVYGAFQDPKPSAPHKPSHVRSSEIVPTGGSATQKPVGKSVPQVVSYSSRIVTKISEVTRSMNISAGASVKSGSVTVLGNQSAIDESKLSTSDLNVVISVKVVNREHLRTVSLLSLIMPIIETTSIDSAKEFVPAAGVTQDNFHYVYGDSYISGFIDGGEFHSLVSIRVLDSSQKEDIVSRLKERLNGADPKLFALKTNDTSETFTSELSQTETSIFVNWCGGGQIKPAEEQWTLDSIFRTAAGFPNKVAQYPQRCWAILTRYSNNFSFLSNTLMRSISVRNFTNVQQYASDLLDDFMGHKSNLRIIESIFDEPIEYRVGPGQDPIDVRAQDLVRQRKKIKDEMAKIVKVIEALDEDPAQGMKTKRPDIEPPEVWATRLPVRRTAFEADQLELAPISEHVENILKGFNFAWESTAKERAELIEKLQRPPPPTSKPPSALPSLPPIATAKAREGMVKGDLEWVDSRDNLRKFGAFLFDESYGAPNQPTSFNDAVEIENAKLVQAWPAKLELGLVKLEGKDVLGYYKLDYSGPPTKNITNGGTDNQVPDTEDQKGKLVLQNLTSTDRIIGVTLAMASEGESFVGIKFIQIEVKDGPNQALGKASEGDLVVKCLAPDGFGLKGFYGYARKGKVIERIGVIWGK